MPSYRTERIKYLKYTAIQAFQKIPQDRHSMSMVQYISWASDYYTNKSFKKNPKRMLGVADYIFFRDTINSLVDMGELDFDESTPLEGIIKILEEK